MAKYGVNYYGATKYGALAKLVFSVEPMSILVLDFTRVYISWQTPRGTFSRVRLVRNQTGFPETAEDGVIIFDEFATEGTVSRSYFVDGEDNLTDIPFVPGRQAYYRFFVFTDQKVWRTAGSITTVIPSNHNTQWQFMNTLPRVYSTKEQSPLGSVDDSSALYKFMEGMLFSQEEAMSYLDLLRPTHTGLETPFELLAAFRANFGLTPEPALPVRNQKRLIREALYMYGRKGTALSLGTYVESLTNFNPTITVSSNLLLTVQDSTFYDGIGNWIVSNAVLTSSTEQVPDSNTNQIDTTKTGKVVASAAGSMALGYANPTAKTVTGLQRNASTTVLQVAVANHGYSVGQTITLSGLTSDFNGTYSITAVPASNQFNVTTVATTSYNASALNGSVIAVVGGGNVITQGVPILPNTEYTVSCKLKSPASAGNITLSVTFYDKDGQPTSAAKSSTAVAANNTWKSASKTATSDADSSYAGISINYSAAGTYYIDQVCMQTGAAVVYGEARAIDIFLNSPKTNYVNNPSFEVNVTDSWTIDGSATVAQNVDISDLSYSGTKSAKIIGTGPWSFTSNAIPIEQGVYYTMSGLIKSNADINVTFVGRDINGDVISTEDLFAIDATTDWAQFSITHLTDIFDATVATYELMFEGDTGTIYLDCIQFEKAIKASDYFDGNLPTDFGAIWEGTENNSYTHLYTNKLQKVSRLAKTMKDWIPMDAFWVIRSYAGVEFTNLTV